MNEASLTNADIVIIGAGVMGASIAFQLSKRTDKRIVVVDQHPPLGGMSGRTFGQIRLHYSNELTLKMAQRGVDFFTNWAREVGYGDPGYVPMGYLLFVGAHHLAPLRRNIDLAADLGIDTRFVNPDQIKALEPTLNTDGLSGGVYDPAGGYIDVTRIVLSFLTAAQERGVRLLSGVQVEAIRERSGRVFGVTTDKGFIQAPRVISATGPWTQDLFAALGIDLPIEARRLDMLYMRQKAGGPQLGRCITDSNSNIVVRPDKGRDFLAAAYPPEMPLSTSPAEGPNDVGDAEHLARVRAALIERLPGFVQAEPVRSVAGSYDITPDWHPIIGEMPTVEGLIVAAGFSGHGLKLSPAVGETVADLVLGREPQFDIHALRPKRFADGEPMFCAYGPGARA